MEPPPHTVAHTTTAPPTTARPTRSPTTSTNSQSSLNTTSSPRSPTTVHSRLLTLRSSPTITTSRDSHPTPSRPTIPPPRRSPRLASTTLTHGTLTATTPKWLLSTIPGTTHLSAFSTLLPRSPSSPLPPSQSLPVVATGSNPMVVHQITKYLLSCSCNCLTSLLSSSRQSTKSLEKWVTPLNSQSTSLELSKTM